MSPKKVVYVEIDDEITSIYDRVKLLKQKEVYLIVPKKAILFQSIVNLKILKSKLESDGKSLIIVTTDRMGRHLAEKVGLTVYRRMEIEEIRAFQEETPKTRIEPIQARRNEILKDQPQRSTEKKITIGELIKDFRERSKVNKKNSGGAADFFHFSRPNRKFLALILVVSIALFMLIGYIALPGATIYIRPKFDNISHTINVVLADKRKNQSLLGQNKPHIIASEEVVTTTKQTKVFNTTSKRFDGVNATGKITIMNSAKEEWTLKGGTRFQTKEGLIFRSKEPAIVPPATVNDLGEEVYGEYTVSVEADPFDRYSDPVGERANIGPTRFTIPGLSNYNQKIIWGESTEPMRGGVTKYEKVVLEEDIEAAKKQIEDNLILMAKEDLRSHIEEMNKMNHTHYVLLDDRRYLKTELLDLRISDDLAGSAKESFEVFASIKAQGVAYDSDQLFAVLKKEIKTRTHPDMRLQESSVTPDTISYEVIDEDAELGQIKITATIQGIEEYVIDSSMEAGLRFSQKVKEKAIGLSVEEAEGYIGNLPEVDAVRIKLWPVWLSKLPRVPDNIKIELMEE